MQRRWLNRVLSGGVLVVAAQAVSAEVVVGVTLPLTGPASGLGIPMGQGVKLWPSTIGGEKLRVVVLDDASDPSKGTQNAKKLVAEDRVDVLVGSGATPVAATVAQVALESETLHLALSPVPLPAGRDAWTFRFPHSTGVMAEALVAHMKKTGVKSVGFIGYSDAYGEAYLQEMQPRLKAAGITLAVVERFARTDTSVTSQALRIASAKPDGVLVVASGSGTAMPQIALSERGYAGTVYQSGAAATRDFMRVGGKVTEGTFVVAGPMMVPEQLPDAHPSKAVASQFARDYEAANGAASRNQLAAHAYDVGLVLQQVVPVALKAGKPGSREFRAALKSAVESMKPVVVSSGVLQYSAQDHWGYPADTAVILKVVDQQWKLER